MCLINCLSIINTLAGTIVLQFKDNCDLGGSSLGRDSHFMSSLQHLLEDKKIHWRTKKMKFEDGTFAGLRARRGCENCFLTIGMLTENYALQEDFN